ncbi:RNA-binding protein [Strigomonas culicis]|uniref:RNA-binding protein n=1 Tax=Strigomonas culicis TaxID=28005 RepID=S9W793_9TRYP|nr:RNA-binding protein [Strigomonas culicis]EPY31855.1 RNA-binding protein [Strigomonas culicis]|eukprot:EPY28601.1 RNA-binding protein [Strigomonas culicis]
MSDAILFVSNLSAVANAQYLERLFSTYGEVRHVQMFDDSDQHFAEVTFAAVDDADAAVAALHNRYCTSRNLYLIVLYSKRSPAVSDYGRRVGQEFAAAVAEHRQPQHIALDNFDPQFERNEVQPPPCESEILADARTNHTTSY